MRISDWSSDVCSSDLLHLCRQLDPGHHPDRADAAAQSIQEQLQRRRIVRERRAVGARRVQLSVEVSQRYLRAEPRGRRAAGTPAGLCQGLWLDRTSAVEGKSVSVRVDLGGRRIIKKKTQHHNTTCLTMKTSYNSRTSSTI